MANEKITLSDPEKVDLRVYKGDTGSFRISISGLDVTEATWDADIRLKADDIEVLTSFDVVPVLDDPTSIDVVLSAEVSEMLVNGCVYDVEMRLLDEVHTLIYGSILVRQDVSRP